VPEGRPADLEKDLQTHMRQRRAIFFDAQYRVPTPHGSRIHTIETVVHKARGVLAELKNLGRRATIKAVESVDWDALGKWRNKQLAETGTKRGPLETIG
jgi:hypothetical protein